MENSAEGAGAPLAPPWLADLERVSNGNAACGCGSAEDLFYIVPDEQVTIHTLVGLYDRQQRLVAAANRLAGQLDDPVLVVVCAACYQGVTNTLGEQA